jgi:hypothetical protein
MTADFGRSSPNPYPLNMIPSGILFP